MNHTLFSEAQSTTNKQKPILENNDRNSRIRIASYNCKNMKTCGQSINSILKNNDIILIQKHWLFHSQINIISDICIKIKFAAKGVDIRDPLLPISLPRGYDRVAVLWNMNIDHLIRPIPDGTEKIQCIELEGFDRNIIIISVYLPAVGSKNHQVEYHECIDELYEIYQKYSNSHDIILGGDINEDLNDYKPNNPRKDYLKRFIHELNLQYENRGNTFTNSKECECSELDYFNVQNWTILYIT